MIKFKRLCGFGVKETSALSRPTTKATTNVSGNTMMTQSANEKLNKTEFNNQEDWETYPTADYCCEKCNQKISFNFANLTKHQFSSFSNLNNIDQKAFDSFVSINKLEPTNSFLDFYCPNCERPVRICYDSWAGGKHGEYGFSIKYILD
jgi:hypothetical protein